MFYVLNFAFAFWWPFKESSYAKVRKKTTEKSDLFFTGRGNDVVLLACV